MDFASTAAGLLLAATISFDVPAVTPAQPLVREDIAVQMPGGRHVGVRLAVTTNIPAELRGSVSETVIEVRSLHDDVQVADYSPRTAMYSDVSGDVRVTQAYQRERDAAVSAKGFYPVFASGQAAASFRDETTATVEMDRLAPMQMLSAAGTLDRRTGVYFKMRSTPQSMLEGEREFGVTLEVPNGWRGDLLEVRITAYGTRSEPFGGRGEQPIASGRFFVALYQAGDYAAAEAARTFIQQHQRLREAAVSYGPEITRRAVPTPMHMIGSALDLYDPPIPSDWLQQWIFGSAYQKPNARLPVDLRVVMLDYQEARNELIALSRPRAEGVLAAYPATAAPREYRAAYHPPY